MRTVISPNRLKPGDIVRIDIKDKFRVPWIGQVTDDREVVCLKGWDSQQWLPDGTRWALGNFKSLPLGILEEGDDY